MRDIKIIPRITNRESECIRAYFQEVNRYPVLTPEEEYTVASKVKEGDQQAKELLINSNLRFVISVSNRYVGLGVDQMDLIEEGNLGLIRAVESFDCDLGNRFCSYAVSWIRQSILAALQEKGRIVYIPLNKCLEIGRMKRFEEQYLMENGSIPSNQEIADGIGKTPEYVSMLSILNGRHNSIDAPLEEGEKLTYLDTMSDETYAADKSTIHESLQEDIRIALSALDERDRNIVELSFGLYGQTSHTLAEISDILGLSIERVRQLKARAIKQLAKSPHANLLKGYLCA